MRSHLATALLATAACTGAGLAAAQPAPIRPGLWRMQMQGDAAMAAQMREMEAEMKAMPAEQRKMMEGMLKQHGMSVAAPGDVKICLTREALAQDGWRGQGDESGCKTDTTRNGNVWTFRSTCPPPHASETVGEASFVSDTRYTVKTTTTVDEGGGRKHSRTMTGTSTWLGADCGDIKPVQPARRK